MSHSFWLLAAFVPACVLAADFDVSTCGQAKYCIYKPDSCLQDVSTCSILAGVSKLDDDTLRFEVLTNDTGAANGYLAVAFQPSVCHSYNASVSSPCMANTPVTECSNLDGKGLTAKLSWNDDTPTNTRFNYTALAAAVSLTLLKASSSNGQTYCALSQKVSNVQIKALPDSDKVLQVSDSATYAFLVAAGRLDNGKFAHHQHPSMQLSTQMISLTNLNQTMPTTTISTVTKSTTATFSSISLLVLWVALAL